MAVFLLVFKRWGGIAALIHCLGTPAFRQACQVQTDYCRAWAGSTDTRRMAEHFYAAWIFGGRMVEFADERQTDLIAGRWKWNKAACLPTV